MFEPKKILVPTDFSEYSDKALERAIDIAQEYNAKVYLLHVVDKNIQQCVVDYCLPIEVVEQLEKESLTKSREMMQDEVSKIPESGKVNIEYEVRKGTPYDEILKEQETNDIDLIVIASHGKTGVIRHVLGNVADRVVENAKAPVLLVRD